MTLSTRSVTARRAAAQNALRRADLNRDGRLSAREQQRARGLVSGATEAALNQAMAQGRVRGGAVSVSTAVNRLSTAGRNALAADRNRDGVISASERARLGGPIARALTQGASGSSTAGGSVGTAVSGSRRPGALVVPAELRRFGNGRIPASRLKSVGQGGHRLYAPAATNFMKMRAAARAAGINLTITDSYRSYAQQVDLARRKGLYSRGGLAATPGRSNHGWGLAIDANVNNARTLRWMRNNAHRFGFYETVRREPWHWEYRPR